MEALVTRKLSCFGGNASPKEGFDINYIPKKNNWPIG
jgi:hypothetical protein